MGSRLFLKIYSAIIASIVILGIAGAVSVALLGEQREEQGFRTAPASIIAAALPQDGDASQLQDMLDRLGPASGAELEVLDADGSRLAYFTSDRPIAHVFEPVVVSIAADRTLIMRMEPPFRPRPGNRLILLAVVSGLTALVAWPVARNLTRRLEQLRQSVENWGAGDLRARAPVVGTDEVAVVARTFNDAAARVEALVTSGRAFLANASHELRSPLARLRMGVELYQSYPNPARREEIDRNLDELDMLVGEILLSSRLNHAEVSEPLERVELLALAAEEAAREGLEATGAAIEITGNSRLLHRMVRNLIQNALRHGRPPVEITVAVRETHAELVVRDHGAGIPAKEGNRVFEPFYRPGGHGETAGGWGLGLALVRQIAEWHGGAARCESPAEGGARFVIELPLEERVPTR